MPIYDRGLSGSRMLRGQSTSLLGLGQPERLPARPEIPQVSVGNVDFLGAQAADRDLGQQQQQQIMGSLLQLAQLGAAGYGAYKGGGYGGFGSGGGYGGLGSSAREHDYLLRYGY